MSESYPVIRKYSRDDYSGWLRMWLANNNGKCEAEATASTWGRLMDEDGPVKGLGAWLDGRICGICHYVLHPTTGAIEPVCYMQDLFVDPACRRRGLARAMLAELEREGRRQGWKRIYWLAEASNEDAAGFYRNIGLKLDFTFHVLPLFQGQDS